MASHRRMTRFSGWKACSHQMRFIIILASLLMIIALQFHLLTFSWWHGPIFNPKTEAAASKSSANIEELPFYTVTRPHYRKCVPGDHSGDLSEAPIILVSISDSLLASSPTSANFAYMLFKTGWTANKMLEFRAPPGGWRNENEMWRGRVVQYLEYAASVPPSTILLFADAFDMLVFESPVHVLHRYRLWAQSTGRQILCGAEAVCDTVGCRVYKMIERFDAMAPPNNPMRYLNAGLMMGPAGTMVEVFQTVLGHLDRHSEVDDQAAFSFVLFDRPNVLGLDYDSIIFGNVSPNPNHFKLHWIYDGALEPAEPTIEIFKGPDSSAMEPNAKRHFPLLLRRTSGLSPSFLHIPGSRYRHDPHQRFNPCQRAAIDLYSSLGMAFYAPPIQHPRPRVVVSMTTTPGRVFNVEKTIMSILEQSSPPDAFYLNLPKFSSRFKSNYVMPDSLPSLPIIINRCDDYGPATKLIPTLEMEKDPSTLIITIDDEYIYPHNMIADLVSHAVRAPQYAYAYAGQMIDSEPRLRTGVSLRSACDNNDPRWGGNHPVDVLEAFLGAIYSRRFFDLDTIVPILPACWTTDDIWISAHLAVKGRARIRLQQPKGWEWKETGNDAISPLRNTNLHGERQNDICAEKLLPIFKTEWLDSPSVCPIAFSSLPTHLPTFGYVSKWWNDSLPFSPCNPAHGPKFRFLLPGQRIESLSSLIPYGGDTSDWREIWSTNASPSCLANGDRPSHLAFQADGNLCLYSGAPASEIFGLCWQSGVLPEPAERLLTYGKFQLNGVLQIFGGSSQHMYLLWQSNKVVNEGETPVGIINKSGNFAIYGVSKKVLANLEAN